MTIEKSINFFEEFIMILKLNGEDAILDNQYCQASTVAVDALKKQVPRKPLHAKFDEEFLVDIYKCPCCGDDWNSNEYGSGMKYCWECGQALDWGETFYG